MKNIYVLKIDDPENDEIIIYLCRTKKKAIKLAEVHLIYRENGKELFSVFKKDECVEFENEQGNWIDFELTKEPVYE